MNAMKVNSNGAPSIYDDQLDSKEIIALNHAAYEIRKQATRIISMNRWGHIGGSYSAAEILAVLYGKAANVPLSDPASEFRDRVVLSKAHTSPALYAALYHYGYLPEEALYTYAQIGGLDGHLHKGNPAAVECSGGSLGLGLSYCAGLAAALKLAENYRSRVYCILGDGELNEGEVWEAALYAAQYRLDNLIVIVDNNKVMAKGATCENMRVMPLVEKFAAFGFCVQECDGHKVEELWTAMYRARYVYNCAKPNVIIANTVKGRGVAECEFNYRWHTHAPGLEVANRFLQELADKWNKPYTPMQCQVKEADRGLRGAVEVSES